MVNKEARSKILKYLYQFAIDNPRSFVSKESILAGTNITEKELDFHIKYLEDKNLVKLEKFLGGGFIAQITVYGIDSVEAQGHNTPPTIL